MNTTTFTISFIKFFIIVSTILYSAWIFSYTCDNYILYNFDQFDIYTQNSNLYSFNSHKSKHFLRSLNQNVQFSDYVSTRYYNLPTSFITFLNISYPKPIIVLEAIKIFFTNILNFLMFSIIISALVLTLDPIITSYINTLISITCLMTFLIVLFYNSTPKKIKSE